MNKTSIEWVKNPDGSQGYTWNPITGCLNGCPYCYARRLANGRLRKRYLANDNIANPIATGTRDEIEEEAMEKLSDPFYPRFWSERILEPTDNQKPRGIFVCDMSDLFGVGIPKEWTEVVMLQIRRCPQHRFYLLTKQPQNLPKFSPFPPNCWVGVTITGGGCAIPNFITHDAKPGYFYEFDAKVKFISFEPLLYQLSPFALYRLQEAMQLGQVNWLIIGAQTKPYLPPQWEWVLDIITTCVDAGIPYFLKDNLNHVVPKVIGGDGELRQEMP